MKNKILSFFLRFRFHFVFWALVALIFFTLHLSSGSEYTFNDLIKSLAEYLITTSVLVYFNLNFLVPRFLYEKKYFQYAIVLTASTVLYTFLVCIMEVYVLDFYSGIDDPNLFRHLFATNLIVFVVFIVVTTSLKLSKKWYVDRTEMKQLRLEQLETELQLLRTQINPHFLFNTLNNIYSLILSRENEKAGGMILKLSDIMDYMIHDSKQEMVLLETEINHIRNYLDLEKVRLTGQDHIDFISETDGGNYRIAPYILFPLIENGFKHGISNTINNGFIKIHIHTAKGILNFRVENSKPAGTDKSAGNGIGLSNIKRRLAIIYPGKHELKIIENPCSFNVKLMIKLENNFFN